MNIHNRDMFLGQPEQLSLTTSTAEVEEGSKLWQQDDEVNKHLSGSNTEKEQQGFWDYTATMTPHGELWICLNFFFLQFPSFHGATHN